MKRIILAVVLAAAAVFAIVAPAGVAQSHRVCFVKPGVYRTGSHYPTVCKDGPLAHVAYDGHAGCPSTIPSGSTAFCAYHTGFKTFSAYASTKHFGDIPNAPAGFCSPGPCTSWASVGSLENGQPDVGNTSDYTLTLYKGWDYSS